MNKHTRHAQKEWIHGDNHFDKEQQLEQEFFDDMVIISALFFLIIGITVLNACADWLVGL